MWGRSVHHERDGPSRRSPTRALDVVVDLTCDDGSTPIPQSPQEDGAFDDLGISYIHDPVTDELIGSLGSLFIRRGAELAQGDPMATVERMIDAINARDADAYIDLFAPDGGFDPRGTFDTSAMFPNSQPISDEPGVRAWMAIQDAWGFEADVRTCTVDPSEPLRIANAERPLGRVRGRGALAEALPGDHRAVALRAPRGEIDLLGGWYRSTSTPRSGPCRSAIPASRPGKPG